MADLFMVLDPEGTIVRIVTSEAEFDIVKKEHLIDRIGNSLPRGIREERRSRLAIEIAKVSLPRYTLVRL